MVVSASSRRLVDSYLPIKEPAGESIYMIERLASPPSLFFPLGLLLVAANEIGDCCKLPLTQANARPFSRPA